MLPAVFEPKIPAGMRPQTDAVDRAATGTGSAKIRLDSFVVLQPLQLFLSTSCKSCTGSVSMKRIK